MEPVRSDADGAQALAEGLALLAQQRQEVALDAWVESQADAEAQEDDSWA